MPLFLFYTKKNNRKALKTIANLFRSVTMYVGYNSTFMTSNDKHQYVIASLTPFNSHLKIYWKRLTEQLTILEILTWEMETWRVWSLLGIFTQVWTLWHSLLHTYAKLPSKLYCSAKFNHGNTFATLCCYGLPFGIRLILCIICHW